MRIWLVQTGEELPIDPGPPRLWRTCQLARELAERGHDVTYWSSSFNHQKKIQRHLGPGPVDGPGYRFRFFHGRSYHDNMSLKRILSHCDNARYFERAIKEVQKPEVILCGFPLIELANSVAQYADNQSVPFALDSRDMWPDIFNERIPTYARPFARPLMAHWENKRQRAYQKATAVTGITDAFVKWGLDIAQRKPTFLDRSFHLSAVAQSFPDNSLESAAAYWDKMLGPVQKDRLMLCFAGTMSDRLDIATAVNAVKILPENYASRIQLILCGDGDSRAEITQTAEACTNIFIPGWVDAPRLAALMSRSDAGLLPYPNTPDFLASYPNKVGEYLGARLPVVTSLQGITRDMLNRYGLALPYSHGHVGSMRDLLMDAIDNLGVIRAKRPKALEAFHAHFDPANIHPAFADWLEAVAQQRRTTF